MKNNSNSVRTICEIGIFAAIGYAIDELQGILSKSIFVSGGSIGFAMIAVIIIAIRRGWLPAILTGLIIGGLDLATGAYIVHPAQLLLDYILPYAVVGFIGLLRKPYLNAQTKRLKITWLILLTTLGGLFKFTSHYLAGVIFWADPSGFAWGLNSVNPYLYSFIYNIAYIFPSIILTAAILVAIYLRAPKVLEVEKGTVLITKERAPKLGLSAIIALSEMIIGTTLFVVFLIKYIQSFEFYDYGGAIDYNFDGDSMLIFVLSFMIVIAGVLSILLIRKNKYSYRLARESILIILTASVIYAAARLIRYYIKGYNADMYRMWLAIGVFTIFVVYEIFTKHEEIIKINGR